jgi:hypothetical protein
MLVFAQQIEGIQLYYIVGVGGALSRATGGEADDPARRRLLGHTVGPARVPYTQQPPTPAILEVLVGQAGEEALRDDTSVGDPPRVHVDTRDGGCIF